MELGILLANVDRYFGVNQMLEIILNTIFKSLNNRKSSRFSEVIIVQECVFSEKKNNSERNRHRITKKIIQQSAMFGHTFQKKILVLKSISHPNIIFSLKFFSIPNIILLVIIKLIFHEK